MNLGIIRAETGEMEAFYGEKYKMKDIKELGEQLGELQRVCREKKIPVMIAFEGYGAAGKGLQIGNLIQAFDPRGFKVYAVKNETEEEWMHPFMWRFWTKIPEKGRIAFLIPAGTGEL